MNELFPIFKTDIYYYSKKANKRKKIKDCSLLSNFLFNKNDFYLLYKNHYFFICYSYNDDMILLWDIKEKEGNEKHTSGEVMSLFRKYFLKYKITQEQLVSFLQSPSTYNFQPKN